MALDRAGLLPLKLGLSLLEKGCATFLGIFTGEHHCRAGLLDSYSFFNGGIEALIDCPQDFPDSYGRALGQISRQSTSLLHYLLRWRQSVYQAVIKCFVGAERFTSEHYFQCLGLATDLGLIAFSSGGKFGNVRTGGKQLLSCSRNDHGPDIAIIQAFAEQPVKLAQHGLSQGVGRRVVNRRYHIAVPFFHCQLGIFHAISSSSQIIKSLSNNQCPQYLYQTRTCQP